MILAASVFWDIVRTKTDRQTDAGENPPPATAVGMDNQCWNSRVQRISSNKLVIDHFSGPGNALDQSGVCLSVCPDNSFRR